MNPKLRAYLSAPPRVSELFDRQLRERIDRDLARDRAFEQEFADDALVQGIAGERRQLAAVLGLDPPVSTVDVRWSASWDRRATAVRRLGPDAQTYDRLNDPLRAIDLREVWLELTGEEIGRCPHPDHDDQTPSCSVSSEKWYCHACGARGDIIDLGSHRYGIEPRGADFHRIRERLLAELGMEAAA